MVHCHVWYRLWTTSLLTKASWRCVKRGKTQVFESRLHIHHCRWLTTLYSGWTWPPNSLLGTTQRTYFRSPFYEWEQHRDLSNDTFLLCQSLCLIKSTRCSNNALRREDLFTLIKYQLWIGAYINLYLFPLNVFYCIVSIILALPLV